MKKKRKLLSGIMVITQVLILVVAATALIVCSNPTSTQKEQAKPQSATISLFGGANSATVKGTLTDTEWSGVADKIANTINDNITTYISDESVYQGIFNRGITIIVEKTSEYVNYKTIGDGKTIYINFSKIDTMYILDGIVLIYRNESVISKAIVPALVPGTV